MMTSQPIADHGVEGFEVCMSSTRELHRFRSMPRLIAFCIAETQAIAR